MSKRLELHNELLKFIPNVYFQPPSNIKMVYPCITYNKTGRNRHFGDNVIYLSQQGYHITVIEHDPDSDVSDRLETHFEYCGIIQHFTVDGLNHTTLQLYY